MGQGLQASPVGLKDLLVAGQGEDQCHVDVAAFAVEVVRADGEKCPRCWRTVEAVSSAAATAGLCERCVQALPGTTGPVAA